MWDIRYRPMLFTDVIGQNDIVKLLKSRLSAGTAGDTSYIFSGAHGSGKTSIARIFARAMLCQNLDKSDPEPCNTCESCVSFLEEANPAYVEQDAASKGTIEHIRAIVDSLSFAVLGGYNMRLFLFDESHRMSRDSQDALLKPIEDKKMRAIFCTTEPEKVRGTIRSRCEEHSIRKIVREDILGRMQMILTKEGVAYEDDAILTIIDYCDGHVRDVVNKLEMLAQLGPVTLESVRERLNLSMVSAYYEILLALDNPSVAIELLERACDRVSPDDVANGMAEAAMNTYRMAHGLYASYVTADKDLARRLNLKYGDSVIRLADKFAKARYNTKISLVCDALVALPGSAPLPAVQIAPPQVVLPLHVTPQAAPQVAPQAVLQMLPPSLPQTAPQGIRPPAPKSLPPIPLPVVTGPDVRPDGIGNRKDDPLALTDLDKSAVPKDMPRGRAQVKPPNFNVDSAEEDMRILTPVEWRLTFERLWPRASA